jgi:hypothetical protein
LTRERMKMRKHRPLKQMSAVDSNTLKLETDMSPNTILHYEKAKNRSIKRSEVITQQ